MATSFTRKQFLADAFGALDQNLRQWGSNFVTGAADKLGAARDWLADRYVDDQMKNTALDDAIDAAVAANDFEALDGLLQMSGPVSADAYGELVTPEMLLGMTSDPNYRRLLEESEFGQGGAQVVSDLLNQSFPLADILDGPLPGGQALVGFSRLGKPLLPEAAQSMAQHTVPLGQKIPIVSRRSLNPHKEDVRRARTMRVSPARGGNIRSRVMHDRIDEALEAKRNRAGYFASRDGLITRIDDKPEQMGNYTAYKPESFPIDADSPPGAVNVRQNIPEGAQVLPVDAPLAPEHTAMIVREFVERLAPGDLAAAVGGEDLLAEVIGESVMLKSAAKNRDLNVQELSDLVHNVVSRDPAFEGIMALVGDASTIDDAFDQALGRSFVDALDYGSGAYRVVNLGATYDPRSMKMQGADNPLEPRKMYEERALLHNQPTQKLEFDASTPAEIYETRGHIPIPYDVRAQPGYNDDYRIWAEENLGLNQDGRTGTWFHWGDDGPEPVPEEFVLSSYHDYVANLIRGLRGDTDANKYLRAVEGKNRLMNQPSTTSYNLFDRRRGKPIGHASVEATVKPNPWWDEKKQSYTSAPLLTWNVTGPGPKKGEPASTLNMAALSAGDYPSKVHPKLSKSRITGTIIGQAMDEHGIRYRRGIKPDGTPDDVVVPPWISTYLSNYDDDLVDPAELERLVGWERYEQGDAREEILMRSSEIEHASDNIPGPWRARQRLSGLKKIDERVAELGLPVPPKARKNPNPPEVPSLERLYGGGGERRRRIDLDDAMRSSADDIDPDEALADTLNTSAAQYAVRELGLNYDFARALDVGDDRAMQIARTVEDLIRRGDDAAVFEEIAVINAGWERAVAGGEDPLDYLLAMPPAGEADVPPGFSERIMERIRKNVDNDVLRRELQAAGAVPGGERAEALRQQLIATGNPMEATRELQNANPDASSWRSASLSAPNNDRYNRMVHEDAALERLRQENPNATLQDALETMAEVGRAHTEAMRALPMTWADVGADAGELEALGFSASMHPTEVLDELYIRAAENGDGLSVDEEELAEAISSAFDYVIGGTQTTIQANQPLSRTRRR